LVIDRRPTFQVLVEVPYFHKERVISFLVDSGSVFSAITEKETSLMGIECALLPEAKGEAIGFGGFFKNKMINKPVSLTFDSGNGKHKINYSSGLKVICVPLGIEEKDRERYLRLTPSVLGMDILCKFETRISRNKVELELVE
jgi:hypothetical protein